MENFWGVKGPAWTPNKTKLKWREKKKALICEFVSGGGAWSSSRLGIFWPDQPIIPYTSTSLIPVPNAQVCVFDSTYYKITTINYISKTSLYITFCIYPYGPWPLKILMFALLVTCEIATYSWAWEKTRDGKYMLGLLLMLISKSWGCHPPPGWACLSRQRHMCTGGGGGGIFLFQGFFHCNIPTMDGWRDGWMDGWKASRKTTMTSFTVCNYNLVCCWAHRWCSPHSPITLGLLLATHYASNLWLTTK